MRAASYLLGLALPLAAQVNSAPTGGSWTLGIQRLSPDLTGTAFMQDGSNTTNFDLQKDLNLGKDSTAVGFLLGYEGPRFLFQVSSTGQKYAGRNFLVSSVTVDGTTYTAGTDLQSRLKLDTTELTWVIKVLRWDQAYIGVDLGANVWKLDVDATGNTAGNVQSAHDSLTAPIPQIGASVGAHLLGNYLDLRGSYHFLSKSGASYHHTVLEARAYPLKWLGVRVFNENESVDVPKDSLSSDFALKLDRKGTGFGVIFRF